MRLLLRSETGKVSLTKDLVGDDPIPPYAILSHTWGSDNDEVTFEEMTNGIGKKKLGYEKIRFCGEQARKDGLQHFWVDTCCIKKSSDSELSESLNSMFRWYQHAAKCYVYLGDVSTTKRKRGGEDVQDIWEPTFRKSRWFTRGWTLQELLAPNSVEFSSRQHKRLGEKKSLQRQISEITGIPIAALLGSDLSQFSSTQKFEWAKTRQTKRKEDWAYSLLGIFEASMPVVYGEGRIKAVRRLEREIDDALKDQECIQHLRITNPCDDKKRIEETKGGLLEQSYHWILESPHFKQWCSDQQSRLLWIKGDPGKGKTMLLCGIINELEKSKVNNVSYFFCQATDSRINNATAVLRDLVYLLIVQQPFLASHVRKKYDHAGRTLFQDANTWVALSEIFASILQDPSLNSTYLIIDALDECETGLPQLLRLIIQSASRTPHVKWIVSSRNRRDIEAVLKPNDAQRLSLELNAKHVSYAVEIFINQKVSELASIEQDGVLQDKIRNEMHEKANGTFLWVALIFQALEREMVESWDILQVIKEMPADLQKLYDRMMTQVQQLPRKEPAYCRLVLSTVTLAYRLLHLLELRTLSGLPGPISKNLDSITKNISNCGSFLTIRDGYVYLIHQSAKDYLDSKDPSEVIFHTGRGAFQYELFSKSVKAMSQTLQQDIYSLRKPGTSINSVDVPNPDPLAPLRYSCTYWASHFQEACKYNSSYQRDLTDGEEIYQFLLSSFLYWLEALGLLGEISMGILAISSLKSCILADKSPNLYALVHDVERFTLSNRSIIEQTPLQLYCSALLFAPEKSIVRAKFERNIPAWIEMKSKGKENWSATLQTLEGHLGDVNSVAFSPDGKRLASGSWDKTVRLWDTNTGAALQTLEGHSDIVNSVAFSPDSKRLASGSDDKTVRLWDTNAGTALQTLRGHSGDVKSVAFSLDGRYLITDRGLLDISLNMSWDSSRQLCTLSVSNEWVSETGENILWLPPDYRASCVAIWNGIVALGHSSGSVSFLEFNQRSILT